MLHEILCTECYTLIDALIWMGMGLALGLELRNTDKKKRKGDF